MFELRTVHGVGFGESSALINWAPGDIVADRNGHNALIVAVYPPATADTKGTLIVERDTPRSIEVRMAAER